MGHCVRTDCKTISVGQPSAIPLVRGIKDIENRSWATRYRGPGSRIAASEPSLSRCHRTTIGHHLPEVDLPLGGIVDATNIIDRVDAHPSPWFEGEFGFVRSEPRTPLYAMEGLTRSTLATAALVDAFGMH
jgi:hypothetical protein